MQNAAIVQKITLAQLKGNIFLKKVKIIDIKKSFKYFDIELVRL